MNEEQNDEMRVIEINASWGIFALEKAVREFQCSLKPDIPTIMSCVNDAMRSLRRIETVAFGISEKETTSTNKMLNDIYADSIKKTNGF